MLSRLRAPALVAAAPVLLSLAGLTAFQDPQSSIAPPPASFAILARDQVTGEYGVAAASNAPLIGMNLEFLDYRVGGVIVLGGPFLEVNQRTMIGMEDGLLPGRAITIGLYGDEEPESRQVIALSPNGAAAFTGKNLEAYAGDKVGNDFVIAGHRLAGPQVILALEESFATSEGPLADRLLAALEAGRDAGGEKDGVHSAALLVVGPGAKFATRDRLAELRIDYTPGDAVAELVELRQQIDSIYGVVR
ncbi:MAG TPA: DUF1028 domain-containing protein [Gemmatimonadota bacterium]|nr:DUF1028 domain-containing protein [Gemmatimonadota bacterium]